MKGNKQLNTIKFAVMSVIGAFLFLVPIPDGDGAFNIPLGYVIGWVGSGINTASANGFGLLFLLAAICITVSFLGTVVAYVFKPAFIMNNEKLKGLFHCNIVYFVSKGIGAVLVWLVFFDVGPDWLIGWDGATLMMDLISSNTGLMAIFIVLGLIIPVLTDFGLMEFLGTLIRKAVRFLFTLPGRSAIDLISSWFSSSAAGVIITRNQHEAGYYTHREAASICLNFTLVSVPFTFVVAGVVGLTPHFFLFYLAICVVSILLAILMPRIWPLSKIKDEYLPEVGKQIDEEVPDNTSVFAQSVKRASQRASQTSPKDVLFSGLSNWLSIFMDLIPVILAWGTIALIIQAQTPIFEWLSWPFGQLLRLLQVEGAIEYAPATIVGFIDMYIPAILLEDAPIQTRFILGTLSIVQIVYMAETGILILKSKIPVNIGHLAIVFLMRTVIALPLLTLFARLFFNP